MYICEIWNVVFYIIGWIINGRIVRKFVKGIRLFCYFFYEFDKILLRTFCIRESKVKFESRGF